MADHLEGQEEFLRKLDQTAREFPREASRALYEEALVIEGVSRERSPVLSGAMKGSHVTSVTSPPGSRDIVVEIRVGGPAAPYAVYVHENLEADHEVGQAKFLESAVYEAVPTLLPNVARRIRSR